MDRDGELVENNVLFTSIDRKEGGKEGSYKNGSVHHLELPILFRPIQREKTTTTTTRTTTGTGVARIVVTFW